ncbi:NAD-dependent malic enzyme [Cohnella lupini]|uniref:Malate dehydrogenase (Oxaloacetate-decarboxylating) n=1 Tax=Cohnella lupini TaxID=1294267 RepID=A0A3D9IV41_9BACL|nr:NAD-dependent malic enzyme [Cohnella lupini]RED65555.1 malate dehydrogenase (oxaloacetate-decarboxylating) [Cohnella lupini]
MRFEGGTSVTLRVEMDKQKVTFAELVSVIGQQGGDIVAIDVIRPGRKTEIRDLSVSVVEPAIVDSLAKAVQEMNGIHLVNVSDRTFLMHLGGKIQIQSKQPIKNRDDLSRVYTPGVAKVCLAIRDDINKAHSLTIRRNTVAVVSDGTAVLGLGDIGPHAAMPVMEGKAMLFKEMAGVDAFPICLDTKDTEEIIAIVKAIAPTFGGINLEDISSPRCFEIERRLQEALDIPVFHDDQHGTAVVLLAGLINALKIVGKSMSDIKVVVCGIGAAGIACSRMLLSAGVTHLVGVDKEGAIHKDEKYENEVWNEYAAITNPRNEKGSLSEVIRGADVFIGLSRPKLLSSENVRTMNADPIVFAMANPDPEITPEEAGSYVRVYATGRSDYPNQLNNVLVFPGIFRGALDARASTISESMKLAAAKAIASIVTDEELNEEYIIPSVFNDKVVPAVRKAVIQEAIHSGVARKVPGDFRNLD